MTNKRARVGVIGAGSWTAASHLPNLERHRENLEFVGINRLGQDKLRMLKEKHRFEVASEDYQDVLEAGVDLVVVGSPGGLHHEHAKAALEAGAHVLVEKPFTITAEDAWDLVETAQRVDREIVVSFGWNFFPMLLRAKELMEEPGIGEVEHAMIHMASVTRELLSGQGAYPGADPEALPETQTWTDTSLSGGGYGYAQLSHALGMGLWLGDLRAESAFAFMATAMDAPVELFDAITLRYEDGAVGTLSGAASHEGANDHKHQMEVRLMGSEGQLHVDVEREIVWLYRPDGFEERVDVEPDEGRYHCDFPIDTLVDIALGRPTVNAAPGELGARTVEALEMAYRSAREGTIVEREAVLGSA